MVQYLNSTIGRAAGAVALVIGAAILAASASARDISDDAAPVSQSDAPIALLVDLTSGQVLFERAADRRFVPASITKAMTAFLAFEKIEAGEIDPRQVYTVSDNAFRNWRRKGSTMFLNRGDRVTVDQLLRAVTTISANDASVVLAEGASGSLENWLDEMNTAAQRIGMRDSHFGSPNGFPDDGHTFVTANDLAILGEAMLRRHPSKYRSYIGRGEFTYRDITQPNRDPLRETVVGADGIKTGFTYQAGFGFLGSAEREGRRLVMVVAGSDSGRERNRAARALMEWGFDAFDALRLFGKDEIVAHAEVQDGSWPTVDLVAPHLIAATIPSGADPRVTLEVRYDGPVRAPIAKGERIAQLHIKVAGMPESSVPLLAAENVPQAGFVQRIGNGIWRWLT